jgi:hypothetical protein
MSTQSPPLMRGVELAWGQAPDSFVVYLEIVPTGISYEICGGGPTLTGVLVDIFAG